MKTLSRYILTETKNPLDLNFLFNGMGENITMDECLKTYDEEYITEGLWGWFTSLFKSDARKKYQEAYESWLKEHNEAKKQVEQQKKLDKEFADKKKALMEKLKSANSDEDVAKLIDEMQKLCASKVDVEAKGEDAINKELEQAPSEVKNETAMSTTERVMDMLRSINSVFAKASENAKKSLLEVSKKYVDRLSQRLHEADDATRKEIETGIKNADANNYLEISGNEVKFNDTAFEKAALKNGEDSVDNKPLSKDDAAQEIKTNTIEAIKDNASALKGLIESSGIKINSEKLAKAVENILTNVAQDEEPYKGNIGKATTLGMSIMLLGALMTRNGNSDRGTKGDYNKVALEKFGKWLVDNAKTISVKQFK